MKKILFVILSIMLLIVAASAHGGRTDSDGGHYDRSTGKYHWHHGYSAHQHKDKDGDGYKEYCPYEDEDDEEDNRTEEDRRTKEDYEYKEDDNEDKKADNKEDIEEDDDKNSFLPILGTVGIVGGGAAACAYFYKKH